MADRISPEDLAQGEELKKILVTRREKLMNLNNSGADPFEITKFSPTHSPPEKYNPPPIVSGVSSVLNVSNCVLDFVLNNPTIPYPIQTHQKTHVPLFQILF